MCLVNPFVRPGELRKAEWADIDLEKAEWQYLVTKTGTPHIVTLSALAVEILKGLYRITGKRKYVFRVHARMNFR